MHPHPAEEGDVAEDASSQELGEHLVRAAAHAYVESDEAFFLACEERWARRFAPDGPTLRSLIEAAHGRPPEDRSNGTGARPQQAKRGSTPRRSSAGS
jgi:hypothetical protein